MSQHEQTFSDEEREELEDATEAGAEAAARLPQALKDILNVFTDPHDTTGLPLLCCGAKTTQTHGRVKSLLCGASGIGISVKGDALSCIRDGSVLPMTVGSESFTIDGAHALSQAVERELYGQHTEKSGDGKIRERLTPLLTKLYNIQLTLKYAKDHGTK